MYPLHTEIYCDFSQSRTQAPPLNTVSLATSQKALRGRPQKKDPGVAPIRSFQDLYITCTYISTKYLVNLHDYVPAVLLAIRRNWQLAILKI